MQGTTRLRKAQLLTGALGHGLVIVSISVLALLGQVVPEQAGWVLGGRDPAVVLRQRGCARGGRVGVRNGHAALWLQLVQTGQIALLRSLLLWGLWHWSGQVGPAWLRLWPWALWLWRSLGLGWPGLRRCAGWDPVAHGLMQGKPWLTLGYGGLVLAAWLQPCWAAGWSLVRQSVGRRDGYPHAARGRLPDLRQCRTAGHGCAPGG